MAILDHSTYITFHPPSYTLLATTTSTSEPLKGAAASSPPPLPRGLLDGVYCRALGLTLGCFIFCLLMTACACVFVLCGCLSLVQILLNV